MFFFLLHFCYVICSYKLIMNQFVHLLTMMTRRVQWSTIYLFIRKKRIFFFVFYSSTLLLLKPVNFFWVYTHNWIITFDVLMMTCVTVISLILSFSISFYSIVDDRLLYWKGKAWFTIEIEWNCCCWWWWWWLATHNVIWSNFRWIEYFFKKEEEKYCDIFEFFFYKLKLKKKKIIVNFDDNDNQLFVNLSSLCACVLFEKNSSWFTLVKYFVVVVVTWIFNFQVFLCV